MDALIRISLLIASGALLIAGNVWFLSVVVNTQKDLYVIAPVKVTGSSMDMDGTALATLLQARIKSIEAQLSAANEILVPMEREEKTVGTRDLNRYSLSPIDTLRLPTAILTTPDVNLKVSGVEVGGWVAWLRAHIAHEPTLAYTIFFGGDDAASYGVGDVHVLNTGQGGVVTTKAKSKASISDILQDLAYATIQARLSQQQGNRVAALSLDEFKVLVDGLLSLSQLSGRSSRGMTVTSDEYKQTESTLQLLSDKAGRWPELDLMLALVSERAENYEQAAKLYRTVQVANDQAGADLKRAIADDRIVASIERCDTLRGKGGFELSEKEKSDAENAINLSLTDIWSSYEKLFGFVLPRPEIQVVGEANVYYSPSENRIVASAVAKDYPEAIAHEAAAPFLLHVSPFASAFNTQVSLGGTEAKAILLAFSDCLSQWYVQRRNGQSAAQADWRVGFGLPQRWGAGGRREPVRSLRSPKLFDYALIGEVNPYVASGIGSKAFYELAMKVGTDEAMRLWIQALSSLPGEVNYRAFALATESLPGHRKEDVLTLAVRRSWGIVNVR